ncbi:MAG: metallophosphoesterase [Flavobacteriia bacterium]|nr:metallophosphoesterase [Flavobacteriia bacterium]
MFILLCKLFFAFFYLILFLTSFIQEKWVNLPKEEIKGRRDFLTKISLGLTAIPFSSLIYGMVKTAFDFKLHTIHYSNSKIPKSFDGFKIVQISDIHTGSLHNSHQLEKAIEVILKQKADLIVFTGDLVNNTSDEAIYFIDILKSIKAPYGVFSILGNHDYGDYYNWPNEEEKRKDFEQMIQIHKSLDWNLLRNESVIIKKDNEQFTLIGVENWGANLHFKKYGDLSKALEGIDKESFQILLSHDPSHWNKEVLTKYPSIDLTLSGHTHGFQFGIEIPGFIKWSPSKYIYPHWAGMYRRKHQNLYVNRGLGCLGYMGRIGIKPEITLIQLHKS